MIKVLDRFIPGLARICLRAFFRKVELIGEERIPQGRPLVMVGNHTNSLVDPALLIGFLPVTPRLLAKNTLWENPVLKPLLNLAKAIPVYRSQDKANMSRNIETFAAAHAELAKRGVIALFPEGASHDEPALLPMKTGAARILLEAEARYGRLGTLIVPVGLIFDRKTRFRSRVLLQIGEPLDPAPEISLSATNAKRAVRLLTDGIGRSLQEVTLNYASWEEARLLERVADLFALKERSLRQTAGLAGRISIRKAFIEGYQEIKANDPDSLAIVYDIVKRYDRLLRFFSLTDAQVASSYPASLVTRYIWRSVRLFILRLPLTVAGIILNWLPYRVTAHIIRRVNPELNESATYKMFGGLLFFPAAWVLEALLAALLLGPIGAGLVIVLAPIGGYVALKNMDRREAFFDEARAYLILRTRKRLAVELADRQQQVYESVKRLVDAYRKNGNL